MSILTPIPPKLPWYARAFYSIPLLGWIARDVAFGSRDNIWYAIVIAVTVWSLSIAQWGLVALTLPFVMAVPLIFVTLVIIASG